MNLVNPSFSLILAPLFLLSLVAGCSDRSLGSKVAPEATRERADAGKESPAAAEPEADPVKNTTSGPREVATFGAGCFWCVEAVLERLDGVEDVASGYMGGTVADPTYEQVCNGSTGHAEVVQVTFDPQVIPYTELLDWFWRLHDPTTLNRQGADVGTQYRSAIFTHSEAQRAAAVASRDQLEEQGAFDRPIVTEITPAGPFYPAEDYHQDYYRANQAAPYCRAVITPKLKKLGMER